MTAAWRAYEENWSFTLEGKAGVGRYIACLTVANVEGQTQKSRSLQVVYGAVHMSDVLNHLRVKGMSHLCGAGNFGFQLSSSM